MTFGVGLNVGSSTRGRGPKTVTTPRGDNKGGKGSGGMRPWWEAVQRITRALKRKITTSTTRQANRRPSYWSNDPTHLCKC